MKIIKICGIIFAVIGLVGLIVGTIMCINTLPKLQENEYVTAKVVRFVDYVAEDGEQSLPYRIYVEFDIDGEKVEAELETDNAEIDINDEIEVYYIDENPDTVYEKGVESYVIGIPIFGAFIILLGAVFIFSKKVQIFLSELAFH